MSISNTIKSIQDIMRKDTGVDGDAQRLSQLVWMLFLKIFDDRETQWELLQDNYKSPLPEKYRWRNWAANPEGLTGDALKDFIDNKMFPELQNLEIKGDDKRAYVVRSVFEDAYNYMKSGQLLRQVINKVQEGVDFNKAQERHLFGDMYEQLLRDLQAAGNAGEFYTPRAVTEFMVRMVNPKLGEKIMDPACGTGGFLTSAIEHVRKQDVKTANDEAILQASIHGFEKKPMPHLLCITNMIFHGIDVPSNIKHDNTLVRPLISWGPSERVDVIITNPPFGGNEEDGIETNFPASFRTKETADLFLVLIMQLLKEGGRAAVVLPDGFLFGEDIKTRVKEKLLKDCNLHTIVRLPKSVFAPYTTIKTNLLFFTKGSPTKDIWFYEQQLPSNIKAYNKTRPMKINDLDKLTDWWGESEGNFKKRKENLRAWKVNLDQIKENNYNLDIKNPHIIKEEVHNPELLFTQYTKYQEVINTLYNNLKNILSDSFKTLNSKDKSSQQIQKLILNYINISITAENEKKSGGGRVNNNAGKIYGIEKIRQLILDLAISGRLVAEKNINNTTVNVLKDVEIERNKLIEKGLLTKKKSLNPVTDDEKIFILPNNWEWTRLGNTGKIFSGNSINENEKRTKYTNINEGRPFIATKDVGYGREKLNYKNGILIPYNEPKFKVAHKNAVLICSEGGSAGRKIGITELDICFGNKLLANETFSAINPRFIFYIYQSQSFYRSFSKRMNGIIGGIAISEFLNIPVTIPPTKHQNEIVSKIDELMVLCDELESQVKEAGAKQKQIADVLLSKVLN